VLIPQCICGVVRLRQQWNKLIRRGRDVENDDKDHPNDRDEHEGPFPKSVDNDRASNVVLDQLLDEVHLLSRSREMLCKGASCRGSVIFSHV